jgi:membrane fusion protein (multidrug efflux system)
VRQASVVLLALLSLSVAGCSGGDAAKSGGSNEAGARGGGGGGGGARGGRNFAGADGPIEVGVVVVQPQRAALTTELPGRTLPFRVAQVRPQISGIIQKRLFEEGAYVQAGQALYQIDPGIYRAAQDSAKAAVAKGEANALTARLRSDRYTKLAQSGVVSQQDRDDVMANLAQAEADLATAKAALETATINLAYTRIVAPIAGRIATSEFTEGALVTANQTQPLTTVQQLNPIYVDLSQSSDAALRLQQQFASGTIKRDTSNRAVVHIVLSDGSTYPQAGNLEFVGVTVSESTSAITLRAIVPNAEGKLLPGLFVRAVVDLGTSEGAILAPQRSVQRDENGNPTVMVLDPSNRIQVRKVTTGDTVGDSWLITSGLAAGDRLVLDGIQKVKDGDTVKPAMISGS